MQLNLSPALKKASESTHSPATPFPHITKTN